MQIKINNASAWPAYQQVVDQIKRDVALGRLKKGQQLPTVRQLAGELTLNPNTIGKAYRQLEQENIIYTRAGAGAFIADIDNQLNKSVRRNLIIDQLEHAAVDAFHMQITKAELRKWFEGILGEFNFNSKEGTSR
ncbi:MAG: GntR family transcriptional regulator [Planctomycetes bacterium]|nr:GntR family transcriptional regulator [Planctomycetota bacterium]